MTTPQSSGGALRAAVVLLALSVYTLVVALVPIRADNDCWWHVKTGQYVWNNGLPVHDVFAHTAASFEWHNHEWLWQLAMHGAFVAGEASGLGGWRGVILLTGLTVLASVLGAALMTRAIAGRWWVALLVGVLCVAVGRRMFYPRPPVVTNLLLVGLMALLWGVRAGWWRPRALWAMVPGVALWTNLHGGWMAGGVVIACFVVEQLVARWRTLPAALRLDQPPVLVPLGTLAMVLPATLLATLVNPYGWKLYELPARVLGDVGLVRSIGELRSPDFFMVIDFELTVLATLAAAMLARGWRVSLFALLVYFFFLHQAIQHVRHLSLFSVAMVPLTAALGGWIARTKEETFATWRLSPRLVGIGGVAFSMLIAGWVWLNPREGGTVAGPGFAATYPGRFLDYAGGTAYRREAYPAALCDWVEMAEPEGKLFNENQYAGYLIWRLAPEKYQVFSDPRFDIFGGAIMREEQIVAGAGFEELPDGSVVELWQGVLDRRGVDWLITSGNRPLARRLQRDREAMGDDAPWRLAAAWDARPGLPTDAWGWQVWMRNRPGADASLARGRGYAALAGAWAP